MTNVNAHSLGIEGIEQETLRKTNVILIPRNTPLPAKRTERFATKSDGQQSIVVKVLEGESSLPGECTAIGRTVVRDLPDGLPKGWPVEVTFEYATNGRLSVRALVPGTHHQAELELERDVGLSGAGIARWKVPISAAAGFDVFEVAVHESLSAPRPAAAVAGSSGILAGGRRAGGSAGRCRRRSPADDRCRRPAAGADVLAGSVGPPPLVSAPLVSPLPGTATPRHARGGGIPACFCCPHAAPKRGAELSPPPGGPSRGPYYRGRARPRRAASCCSGCFAPT